MFQGFVEEGGTLPLFALVRDADLAPRTADAPPTYRVYGPDGFIAGQSGSLSAADSGPVEAASNASPIAVTSAGHGLTTGDRVTLAGVTGNTAANGTFTVTRTGADTFTLDGSTGNGAYASGGTWNVAGLYTAELVCSGANGYEAGRTYTVLVQGVLAGGAFSLTLTFGVT